MRELIDLLLFGGLIAVGLGLFTAPGPTGSGALLGVVMAWTAPLSVNLFQWLISLVGNLLASGPVLAL